MVYCTCSGLCATSWDIIIKSRVLHTCTWCLFVEMDSRTLWALSAALNCSIISHVHAWGLQSLMRWHCAYELIFCIHMDVSGGAVHAFYISAHCDYIRKVRSIGEDATSKKVGIGLNVWLAPSIKPRSHPGELQMRPWHWWLCCRGRLAMTAAMY